MPETTALVDNLDIFIIPQINGDGATTRCMTPTGARTCPTTARTRSSSRARSTDPAQRNSWGVDMNRNFQDGSIFDGFQGASQTDCLERQLRRPLRALRARGPQRDVGADDVPQHQVRQQHPLVRWLLHVAARLLHAGARAAAVPAVRHAELLRPDRQDRPRRHQVAPRHGDPAAADGPGHRRALLGRRQLRGRGVLRATASSASTSRSEPPTTTSTRTTGVEATCGAGQQPPFGDSTNDCLDNEGFHEAMEYASGNYGLLQGRDGLRQRHDGSGRRGDRQVRRQRDAGRPLHQQRGVVDLLHDGRLDADHGLHRVEAEPRRARCRCRSRSSTTPR